MIQFDDLGTKSSGIWIIWHVRMIDGHLHHDYVAFGVPWICTLVVLPYLGETWPPLQVGISSRLVVTITCLEGFRIQIEKPGCPTEIPKMRARWFQRFFELLTPTLRKMRK